MATIEENKQYWDFTYPWTKQGDEWSLAWGGVDQQWYWVLLPRIHAFVPAGTILEIGPGFGRWTQFLKDLCEKLILIDLSEKAIKTCKQRFDSCSNITYRVNDGKSLDEIPESSIDFVFSFDSLVHAEEDAIHQYILQLAKGLKKNGVAFIHHSNLAPYLKYYRIANRIRWRRNFLINKGLIEQDHWRASSMSAAKFEAYVEEAGLQCISQEIINWGGKNLIDCISVFARKDSIWARPNKISINREFMQEAKRALKLSELYGLEGLSTDGD